ncbi:MAG: hypothetical protein IJ121_10950 [Eubacterium sp.]|nr:hypothetical protein [Eubacterium sp.]
MIFRKKNVRAEIARTYRTSRLIRNAIDSYPDGICFATADGRPVLVNRIMNNLCHEITGHTVTNADDMWEAFRHVSGIYPGPEDDLSAFAGKSPGLQDDPSAFVKKSPGLQQHPAAGIQPEEPPLLYFSNQKTIWQFRRQILHNVAYTGDVIQYEAADITELYNYQNQLRENNRRVQAMHLRQKDLLQNIVKNNLEKELLNAKIRIHDQFGRCLIMTRNAMTQESLQQDDLHALLSEWEEVITHLEHTAAPKEPETASPDAELLKAAEMIGCRIIFRGDQPAGRKTLLLLYAAIREALTNAVRHADADTLTVTIDETPAAYHIVIAGNGNPPASPVQETGGLANLRRRLEQEGAAMEIVCDPCVALHLSIPNLS